MISFVLSVLSLVVLMLSWRWFTNRAVLREWKGDTHRFFERDWEIVIKRNRFWFAIPSFKTAFFEIRSPSLVEKLLIKMPWNRELGIEKEFHFESEEPRLDKHFAADLRFADSFRRLSEFAVFEIISSSEELRGVITIKEKKADLSIDSDEFKNAVEQIGHLLEAQFTIPLTEMKDTQIRMWQRMQALPIAMFWAACFLTFGIFAMKFGADLQLALSTWPVKIGAGFAILLTGLSLVAAAWGAPAHAFSRIVARYIFVFSWSVFLWISSTVSAIREFMGN